jgi:dihydroorotate dehydrogenase
MTHGLGVYKEIADSISEYMNANGFSKIDDMVGLAHDSKQTGDI